MSLHCKLVPVQYQEYEHGLLSYSFHVKLVVFRSLLFRASCNMLSYYCNRKFFAQLTSHIFVSIFYLWSLLFWTAFSAVNFSVVFACVLCSSYSPPKSCKFRFFFSVISCSFSLDMHVNETLWVISGDVTTVNSEVSGIRVI